MEVNWAPEVVPCKKVKFTLDFSEQVIDYNEFYTMMLLFGKDSEQEKIIPVNHTEMRVVERMISVRAKNDMKAGEVMSFPYRYAIPESEYKALKALHPNSVKAVEDISTPSVAKSNETSVQ